METVAQKKKEAAEKMQLEHGRDVHPAFQQESLTCAVLEREQQAARIRRTSDLWLQPLFNACLTAEDMLWLGVSDSTINWLSALKNWFQGGTTCSLSQE